MWFLRVGLQSSHIVNLCELRDVILGLIITNVPRSSPRFKAINRFWMPICGAEIPLFEK